HEADHEVVRGQERRSGGSEAVAAMRWIYPRPRLSRSDFSPNRGLSLFHPGSRPFRNPFEVLPFGRGLLPLAPVVDDPLDLPPGRCIHERVEGDLLMEKPASHEGARSLPKDCHLREVFPSFAPAGKSFLESLEAQTVRRGSLPLPSLTHGVREKDIHQAEQELRVLLRGSRHRRSNGGQGVSVRRPGSGRWDTALLIFVGDIAF